MNNNGVQRNPQPAVQQLRSILAVGLLLVLAAYVTFSGLRLLLLLVERLNVTIS